MGLSRAITSARGSASIALADRHSMASPSRKSPSQSKVDHTQLEHSVAEQHRSRPVTVLRRPRCVHKKPNRNGST